MKNLSLTLIVIGAVLFAVNSMGQKNSSPSEDQLAQRQQLRQKMHERMRQRLFFNAGDDDEWFSQMDRMMDQTMKEMEEMFKESAGASSFQRLGQFGATSFESLWEESKDGRILKIKPQSPEQQLDIEVKNGFITIKGVHGQKKEEKQGGVSMLRSSFSSSLSVPRDCDESKVKMESKDGEIVLFFPFKDSKSSGSNKKAKEVIPDRQPIPTDKSDIEI